MTDSCICCGTPLGSNRAKEHVIPAWLQKHWMSAKRILGAALRKTRVNRSWSAGSACPSRSDIAPDYWKRKAEFRMADGDNY